MIWSCWAGQWIFSTVPERLTNPLCIYFRQKLTSAVLESAEGEDDSKYFMIRLSASTICNQTPCRLHYGAQLFSCFFVHFSLSLTFFFLNFFLYWYAPLIRNNSIKITYLCNIMLALMDLEMPFFSWLSIIFSLFFTPVINCGDPKL